MLMARHSPYPVVLSPEERHVLAVRGAQHTRPRFEAQRAKMFPLGPRDGPTTGLPTACRRAGRSSRSGGNASIQIAWPTQTTGHGRAGPESLPPTGVVAVKAGR